MGPKFDNLSAQLQENFVEYVHAVGVRPEVALCVEFLSLNKEQRMYMRWLQRIKDTVREY